MLSFSLVAEALTGLIYHCPSSEIPTFSSVHTLPDKFVEAHSYHFTPLDSLRDNITDTDDHSDLVADVDPDTLVRLI